MLSHLVTIFIFFCCFFITSGCNPQKKKAPEKKAETIQIVYVNWAEGVAMTQLASAIIEEKLGTPVTLSKTDIASVFNGLASGKNQVFLDAWLPVTHGNYIHDYRNQIFDLGVNFDHAKTGLVVPAYMHLSSISQLNNYKTRLNKHIVGIETGAGIMRLANRAIQEYNLDFELLISSESEMISSLQYAIQEKQPIVVTGWIPHWMFKKYDLKFLTDPLQVFGDHEQIHTIIHKGFEDEYPRITAFLKRFKLDKETLQNFMLQLHQSNINTRDEALQWIQSHPKLVHSWIAPSDSLKNVSVAQ